MGIRNHRWVNQIRSELDDDYINYDFGNYDFGNYDDRNLGSKFCYSYQHDNVISFIIIISNLRYTAVYNKQIIASVALSLAPLFCM